MGVPVVHAGSVLPSIEVETISSSYVGSLELETLTFANGTRKMTLRVWGSMSKIPKAKTATTIATIPADKAPAVGAVGGVCVNNYAAGFFMVQSNGAVQVLHSSPGGAHSAAKFHGLERASKEE